MTAAKKLPAAEFIALTDKCLSGEITPEELARWETLCEADPAAFEYYLSLSRTEGLLPEALSRAEYATSTRGRLVRFHRAWVAAAGLAAALGVVAAVTWRAYEAPVASALFAQDAVPARVTGAIGVRWERGETPTGERPALAGGAISSGLLELTLDSGVRLLLQGPATYAVTGPNALRLERGRAVADVPPGARGFVLESPRERIVDHGTRFAVDVAEDGAETLVGVLSGEVELFHGDRDLRLFTDYAVRRTGDEVRSVPFDKSRFVTEKPGREFAWNLDGTRHDTPVTLRYDVSALVHGPGDYRAVVRWLAGFDAVSVRSLRLERDGVTVAQDAGARVGDIGHTAGNAPVLRIAPADYRPGGWSLVLEVICDGAAVSGARPVSSQGVVSFEEGLSTTAEAARFVGRWRYSHDGDEFVREFLPDGTARMTINGRPYVRGGFAATPRYSVRDGVLTLDLADGSSEAHMLRDDRTLIFLNRPYRAAQRE